VKILASSDTHIGRIPSVNYSNITASSGFVAVVATAIKLEVDVLLLGGDIVDNDQYWYEAYGPLLREIDRLRAHNIKLIAVSGNHDSSVFPKLAKEKQQELAVLALDGKWEAYDYNEVRFIGWSFTEPSFEADPFNSFNKSLLDKSKPTIGLIHCDVDGHSIYAPLSSSNFDSYADILWVTGHIHIPRHNKNHINCGSPFPLDSSEKGAHGVWLLENEATRWRDPTFIPISPYRFESCAVKLDSHTTTDNLGEYVVRALKDKTQGVIKEGFKGTLFYEITFEGEINPLLNLKKSLPKEKIAELSFNYSETEINVLENFKDNTTIQLDLEQLSSAIGPKSTLAKILLNLDRNAELLNKVSAISKESFNKPTYSSLIQFEEPLTIEEQKRVLQAAAKRLLSAMVNQGKANG